MSNIKSKGSIQYKYIFSVFENKKPFLHYTAERSLTKDDLMVGVFDQEGHKNFGSHPECHDQMTFLLMALEYLEKELNLDPADIQEIPRKK